MADERSDTTHKLLGGITGKGFVKGDPRINRHGRPKSFDALRELAQQLADEKALDKDKSPIVYNGHAATQIEMILRAMMRENPERFVEITYGKVPTPIEIRDWREAAKQSGIENPDEALNEIVGIIASKMARANDSGGDGEGESTEVAIGETMATSPDTNTAVG